MVFWMQYCSLWQAENDHDRTGKDLDFRGYSRREMLGNDLGDECFKKPQKVVKSPANGGSASR